MYIPREAIDSGVSSLKIKLKELYTMIEYGDENSEHYLEVKNEVLRQESVFRGLFGESVIERFRNEAWLEYIKNS
jgi:hypothetical protein